jgi:hypothetical protein
VVSEKKTETWIEERNYDFGEGYYVEGPIVLKAASNPAFIWQVNTFSAWNMKSQAPYLLVVSGDSFSLLTNFRVMPIGFGTSISSSGFLMSKEDSKVAFTYTCKYDDESDTTSEELSFTVDGCDEIVYNLINGRLFKLKLSEGTSSMEVIQLNYDLPNNDTLLRHRTMEFSVSDLYAELTLWLEEMTGNSEKPR